MSILSVVVLFFLYRVIKHLASNETVYTDYGNLSDDSSGDDDDDDAKTDNEKHNNIVVETVRSRDSKTDSPPTNEVRRRKMRTDKESSEAEDADNGTNTE